MSVMKKASTIAMMLLAAIAAGLNPQHTLEQSLIWMILSGSATFIICASLNELAQIIENLRHPPKRGATRVEKTTR